MRYLPTLCLFLATTLPAVAQDARPATPPDTPLTLSTATCAQARAGRVAPRNLAAALVGAKAARANAGRVSTAAIDAAEGALRAGCEGEANAARRVSAIVGALPAPAGTAGDPDLATLTCRSLGPIWRQEARNLVPFLVGWRDATTDAPLSRAALDRVAEGLPPLCRDQANQDRKVTDLVAGMR